MEFGHGEDGRPVPVCELPWDEIDRHCFDLEPQNDLGSFSQEEVDRGVEVLRALLQWVWQDGMKNPDGLQLRSIVACWVFLKELRPLQLSQLARGFGKQKQSIGRWVDVFKRDFPTIRTPHMRPKRGLI